MKIAQSALHLQSSRTASQHLEIRQTLRIRREEASAPTRTLTSTQHQSTRQTGQSAGTGTTNESKSSDPRLALIRSLLEFLTGRPIRLLEASPIESGNAAEASTTPAVGNNSTPAEAASPSTSASTFGYDYEEQRSYTETENTRFAATGAITTSDGKQLDFSLSLDMSRSYHEESSQSTSTSPPVTRKDPLILNFGGTAAQLTSTRFSFDLDADGKKESIAFASGGSGFLAIDKNGDGTINDGRELFGPTSGNGFSELARLDEDGNGWIDENDSAWNDLRIWKKDANGKDSLLTLANANVGAIAVASTATRFDLRDAENRSQGLIQRSGVFLTENGNAGSVQQLDLTA